MNPLKSALALCESASNCAMENAVSDFRRGQVVRAREDWGRCLIDHKPQIIKGKEYVICDVSLSGRWIYLTILGEDNTGHSLAASMFARLAHD